MKSAAYNKTLCSKQHWMMNEKPNLHLPSLEPQCEKRQTNKQHTEQKKESGGCGLMTMSRSPFV